MGAGLCFEEGAEEAVARFKAANPAEDSPADFDGVLAAEDDAETHV